MDAQTINRGKVNSYIVQKTVGGWVVVYLNEDRSIRNVDGGHVHKSRQNAYAKAKRLNQPITGSKIDGEEHSYDEPLPESVTTSPWEQAMKIRAERIAREEEESK